MGKKLSSLLIVCLLSLLFSKNSHAASSCDTNRDGYISPIDILLVINYLNDPTTSGDSENLDVNLDGYVSPIDILIIINYVNGGGEGSCGKELSEAKNLKIGSPEDNNLADPGTPSTPPPSPSPSPSPSASPSPSPSPSASPSPSPSPSPTPECPIPGEKKDIFNVCCPSTSIDNCGICGGSGPDACGNCGIGPFPPDKTPNQCGGCATNGINSCGDCDGLPGAIVDRGCGCGQPAVGECGCNSQVKGCDGVCGSGKVLSGCDNQCGSTKVADQCGVCGGDGSTCQQCLFVLGITDWSDYAGGVGASVNDTNRMISEAERKYGKITSEQPIPTCMSNKFASLCDYGEGTPNFNEFYQNGLNNPVFQTAFPQTPSFKFWGACAFDPIITRAECDSANNEYKWLDKALTKPPIDIRDFLGNPAYCMAMNAAANLGFPREFWLQDLVSRFSGFSWYFDENCQPVAPAPNAKICGYAGASWSPISLILEDVSDLEKNMQIVDFNLSGPHKQGYSIWKASDKAPLLVYAPKNETSVSSVKQLFGNYAFGGKTNNAEDYSKDSFREPWANGFEALSVLDNNKDGKISDQELDSLALWFDKNKNAKTEKGELVRAKDFGVLSINYKNAQTKENGDVILNKGFVVQKGDKIATGTLVDWYGHTFSSKKEAIEALQSIFAPSSHVSEKDQKSSKNNFEPLKGSPGDELDLTGYWAWTAINDGPDSKPGILALAEGTRGIVKGFSIVEGNLVKNPSNLKSGVIAVPGQGTVKKNKFGQKEVHITFESPDSGGISKTIATISDDGKYMMGVSDQSYEIKSHDGTKSANVKYAWVATKMVE